MSSVISWVLFILIWISRPCLAYQTPLNISRLLLGSVWVTNQHKTSEPLFLNQKEAERWIKNITTKMPYLKKVFETQTSLWTFSFEEGRQKIFLKFVDKTYVYLNKEILSNPMFVHFYFRKSLKGAVLPWKETYSFIEKQRAINLLGKWKLFFPEPQSFQDTLTRISLMQLLNNY